MLQATSCLVVPCHLPVAECSAEGVLLSMLRSGNLWPSKLIAHVSASVRKASISAGKRFQAFAPSPSSYSCCCFWTVVAASRVIQSRGRLLPPPAGKVLPCWRLLAADIVWCTHPRSLPVALWPGPEGCRDGMVDWWAHCWHFSLWPCSRTHHRLACALWRLRGSWGVRGCILEVASLRCLEL